MTAHQTLTLLGFVFSAAATVLAGIGSRLHRQPTWLVTGLNLGTWT